MNLRPLSKAQHGRAGGQLRPIIGLERYQAQHPIPNTLASNDTISNTDTGRDVIRSNKKYISTTGE